MAPWGGRPVCDASCSSEARRRGHGGRGRGSGPPYLFTLSESPQRATAELPPLQARGVLPGGQDDQQGLLRQSNGGASHRDGGEGQS